MNKEAGRKIIAERVEDFEKNKTILTRKGHGETNIRSNYIDKMFKALGWNMQSHYDVVREFSQRDKSTIGGTKKVDYAFKINGKLKFFIEAKEASVDLENDKHAIYQAKRYAYSSNGKAPIAILTDFEEFRVFNVIKAPLMDNTDRELLKSHSMRYTDYLDNWDLLWDTFSKEAVENGSLDKLRGKIDKNTKTMDVDFLEQITGWRESLARNIAIRNEKLNVDDINEAVQRILDRLVFMRNLEDREIEPENLLLDTTKKAQNIYKSIVPLFNSLDNVYNGLLFKKHFSEEINVDDKTIKDIIRQMCYPISPFQFDVIEPEILGRIYEKFLGSKIRLTPNHQAKIEEKIEVRKAGGVYYTPEYIVEYIVQNTVGKKIEGLTPDEIKNIKIVDPACGSGSFLIGAYAYLINYHREWYTANQKDKTYQADWYKAKDGEIKVRLEKRGEILRNNIFGVDIDKEATEVAIMSLYLKMLADGFDNGERDLYAVKGAILPDMVENIKRGNSLIDRETLLVNDMFGDEDIKPFDWNVKLPFAFDVIIGNPPYIRIQEMQAWAPKTVEIYKNTYQSGQKGNFDIYVLFIEKSLSLLHTEGMFGMILPNKFFMSDYGVHIRTLIKDKIYNIVDFGDQQVFENATTYTNLLFLRKIPQDIFKYIKVKDLSKFDKLVYETINKNNEFKNDFIEMGSVENSTLSGETWQFSFGVDKVIFDKLKQFKTTLNDISDKLYQGIVTGADAIFILEEVNIVGDVFKGYSKILEKEITIEKKLLKPLLKGSEIRRYETPKWKYWVIFPYNIEGEKAIPLSKDILYNDYPLAYQYFEENKELLQSRERGKWKIPLYWQFSRNQNMVECSRKKIMTQVLASRASYTADFEGKYYFVGGGNAGGYGIKLKPEYEQHYHYLLGILNSKAIDRYLQHVSTQFRGGFYSYAKRFIEKLPIYLPNSSDKSKFEMGKKIEEYVKIILDYRKNESKQDDADFLENKVNELVYKLYDLTDEEIKIIESK